MSDPLLDAILRVAEEAARAAGAIIVATSGRVAVKEKASMQDLVTESDVEAQRVIEVAIARAFPEHSVLGEESVAAGSAASAAAIAEVAEREWLWVVDPIDGTTNFAQGVPFSCVSIGVAHRGTVVVGVVFEPYRNELFTAVRGRGARLNGAALAVSADGALSRAFFSYGLNTSRAIAHAMLDGVRAITDVSRGARCLGSAALHLAYVAAGRFTGFWELGLSAWDIAAGSLLVTEAGGAVTDTRGAPYSLLTRDVLATNGAPAVHDGVLAALAAAHADRVPGATA